MLSGSQRQALQRAAEKFHASLDERASGYLEARGITEEVASQRLLGLVSADTEPVYADYIGRLAIPFITPSGVVGIRFRCIEEHDCKEAKCTKYLQPKGSKDHLYNVLALHERHPAIAITEGEFDAMIADEFVLPTVGVPGATKWPAHWSRLFDDFAAVYVIGDGDDAGRKFVEKLTELLPNVQPVVMPAGTDVTDYYLEHGDEALARFILGESSG